MLAAHILLPADRRIGGGGKGTGISQDTYINSSIKEEKKETSA